MTTLPGPRAVRQRAGNWWHCVVRGAGGEPHRLYAVESTAYPDASALELAADEAQQVIGDDATCVVEFDDERVRTIRVREHFAPNAPPVWFVEHRESANRPPAVTLVAFAGGDREPGTVLDDVDAMEAGIRSDDQVGAVRWYPGTGEVDQIYVTPEWRRRHIAAVLLSAGNALSLSRGWPRFWGDGQRTTLGERMRDGRSWRSRFDELTHIAPPMTPGDPGD